LLAASAFCTACDDTSPAVDAGPDVGPDAGDADAGDGGPIRPPDPPPQPEFPGLSADVEVLVDSLGIPHIYGQTDTDAFYGAGYMMAHDRLFQMELLRRRALGRWAEVMGESRVGDDEISRLFNFRDLGRRDYESLDEESHEAFTLVVAWCAGVNRFIEQVEEGEEPLPYGFGPDELDFAPERFHPSDLIAVSRLAFFSTSNTLEVEILASMVRDFLPDAWNAIQFVRPFHDVWTVPPEERPETAPFAPAPAPPARPGRSDPARRLPDGVELGDLVAGLHRRFEPFRLVGSNNFAIDGRHTENGRPVIANDPHLMLEVPNVFYALHINSADGEGTFDVAGFTLAGSFGVSAGRNDRLAWTVTTAFGDVMDVWEVVESGDDISVGSRTVTPVERVEPIIVRQDGGPAGEGRLERFEVLDVPGYGVLLPDDIAGIPFLRRNHHWLMNYTGFESFRGADALLLLQRARTLDEFEAAIDGVAGLGFNFVGATAEGIAYRVGLHVPDRGDPASMQPPYLVMDGSDDASYWTGAVLPTERLPHGRAPEQGFLATANNDPFGFTADGDVLNDPWYYGGLFEPGFRARRLQDELERLVARGGVTVDDAVALQLDVHSTLADSLLPRLAEAWSRVGTDADLAEFDDPDIEMLVTAIIDGWDREMRGGSPEAVVFRAFCHNLAAEVLVDDIGLVYGSALSMPIGAIFLLKIAGMAVLGLYPDGDAIVQQGADRALLEAMARTRDWLIDRFGGVDPGLYSYGEVAGMYLGHDVGDEYDIGFVPVDGSDDTVANFPTALAGEPGEERWAAELGPVMRIVSSFGDDGAPESVVAMPLGNSGVPSSPHFDDLLPGFVAGEHRPLPFRRAEVEAAQEERIVLEAEGSARPGE
jgi:penicillin amidase